MLNQKQSRPKSKKAEKTSKRDYTVSILLPSSVVDNAQYFLIK